MPYDLPPQHQIGRLGEEVVPPRAVYISHIPATLVIAGVLTWLAASDLAMMAAGVVGGVVSLYLLWDWLFREGPTRFSHLVALALLMGYGLGTVNTWLTLPRGDLTIAQFLGGDEAVYARGMAAVLIVSAPIIFLGEFFERPLFGSEFRLPLDQNTYLFIFLGTVSVVIGFFTHSLGFQGGQVGAAGQLTVATALLTWMFPPLAALTIAVFLAVRNRFAKVFVGFCTFILCVLIMVIGRRNMIYTSMLVVFTLRLTGYRLKGTFFRKFFLIIGFGLFLFVGVSVFMLLRLAGFQAHNPNTPLSQRIQIALSWVQEGTALNRANEANQTNAQRRTFVLQFFADVLDASTQRTPALGKDFMGFAAQAVPRVLNPEKDPNFSEERLADTQFNLTYRDSANSILTNGATDFGPLGVIAYPLLIVVLFRLCIGFLERILPPLPVTFLALGIMFTLIQTENAIEFYLVTLRNVFTFAPILFVLSRLPRFSLSNR